MNSQIASVIDLQIKKTLLLLVISFAHLALVGLVLIVSVFFTYIPVVNIALVFAFIFSISCAVLTNRLNKLADEYESLVSA